LRLLMLLTELLTALLVRQMRDLGATRDDLDRRCVERGALVAKVEVAKVVEKRVVRTQGDLETLRVDNARLLKLVSARERSMPLETPCTI